MAQGQRWRSGANNKCKGKGARNWLEGLDQVTLTTYEEELEWIQNRSRTDAGYLPTEEEIEKECRLIREENDKRDEEMNPALKSRFEAPHKTYKLVLPNQYRPGR